MIKRAATTAAERRRRPSAWLWPAARRDRPPTHRPARSRRHRPAGHRARCRAGEVWPPGVGNPTPTPPSELPTHLEQPSASRVEAWDRARVGGTLDGHEPDRRHNRRRCRHHHPQRPEAPQCRDSSDVSRDRRGHEQRRSRRIGQRPDRHRQPPGVLRGGRSVPSRRLRRGGAAHHLRRLPTYRADASADDRRSQRGHGRGRHEPGPHL